MPQMGSLKTNLPSVRETTLSGGLQGNMQTLEVMIKEAHRRAGHPIVRDLALRILNQANTQDHFYADESKAIGQYVQRYVRYVKDPTGIEQLHDPLTLIEQMSRGVARGDCDDMALLTATLLLSIGHTPKFRTVRYNGNSGPYNHIYVVDYAKNKDKKYRVVIDCIVKDKPIGFEVPHKSGDEYNIA